MSKTVLAEVSGWTPVIDDVAKDVGVTAAVIFGKVWRYCQMSDGKCWASQERIADELGLSRHCVLDNIKLLIERGYLTDTTPGENDQRRTNIYRDTGKAGMQITVTAGNDLSRKATGTCSDYEQVPVQNMNTKTVVRNNQETVIAENLLPPPPPRVARTADDVRAMTLEALRSHAALVAGGKSETQHFPPDVLQTVTRVCELWNLTPPRSKEARFSHWVKSAGELKHACGEYGISILDDVYAAWLESQYAVASPGSLINSVIAMVG